MHALIPMRLKARFESWLNSAMAYHQHIATAELTDADAGSVASADADARAVANADTDAGADAGTAGNADADLMLG